MDDNPPEVINSLGREGAPGKYEDSPNPVHIKIGALRIGDIALGSANAELYNMIGQ